jgi:Domain of unknown function (DUF4253)
MSRPAQNRKQGGSGMSLTAVPDDDEFCMDGIWMPGRQVRVQRSSARPPAAVAWITDSASSSAGSVWVSLGKRAAATGLQPLLLSGLVEAAQRIAAEHFAFCDEACMGLSDVSEIAPALVNNPFWDFWWD